MSNDILTALTAEAGFVFNQTLEQLDTIGQLDDCELRYSKDEAQPTKELLRSTDLSAIDVLPEYLLIKKLVEQKFPLIFVTGGAGTGKSTFIKWLMKQFKGSALLSAPTAMAAINIEGKTLHSLCQLPPAWIVKKDIKEAPHRTDIKEAKLLIIDEISMVTANLLDGVSAYLRLNRSGNSAFGGMTVIMVGDMFQLPPVVSEASKPLFDQIYGSAKFFKARSLRNTPYYAIELKKNLPPVRSNLCRPTHQDPRGCGSGAVTRAAQPHLPDHRHPAGRCRVAVATQCRSGHAQYQRAGQTRRRCAHLPRHAQGSV